MSAATAKIRGIHPSPLQGVSDFAWTRFVGVMTIDDERGPNNGKPRRFDTRAHGGSLGCFGISPRRLVELGVLKEVFMSKGKAIANPQDKRVLAFLADPLLQRDAFIASLKRYDRVVAALTLPAGMTRSGALALHHRLGPKAMLKWQKHQEPSTMSLFRRANGLF